MAAYYNENDQFAAAWLRNLIEAGLIADGEVDERSIKEVRAEDLKGFAQCHFFAGIGGWSYALRLAGWGDDRPVWTGSCPCQPFSQAGKRKGFADDRHLWPVWRALIEDARPGIVFGEQVASAAEWLGLVRSDMGALGYVFGARPFEAASAGADHLRNRIGFVAHDAAPRKGRRGIQRPGESTRAAQERPSGQPARSSADGTVADSDFPRPHAGTFGAIHSREEIAGTRHGELERRGASRRLDLADNNKGSQGRPLPAERAGERAARPDGVADAIGKRVSHHRPREASGETETLQGNEQERQRIRTNSRQSSDAHEWVLGADGKARRVKPGIRLLVDGFPNRVGLLRGFGNAIDPRAFAQFIAAADEAMHETRAA